MWISDLGCVIIAISVWSGSIFDDKPITEITTKLFIELLQLLQNGDTALMLATSRGHTETVLELLNSGADVNMKNGVSFLIQWSLL